MKKIMIVLGIGLFLVGCAATKTAMQNYQTGANTPPTQQEIANNTPTPAQQAQTVGNTVASIPLPFAPLAGSIITGILTIVGTIKRGARINAGKSVPSSVLPNATNEVATVASNVITGLTHDTGTGSPLSKTVTGILSTIATVGVGAATIPQVHDLVANNPQATALLIGISGVIDGIIHAFTDKPATTASA